VPAAVRPKSASHTDAPFCGVDDGRPNGVVAATIDGSPVFTPAPAVRCWDHCAPTEARLCMPTTATWRPTHIDPRLFTSFAFPFALYLATIDGNAATDERSRPRQDGRGAAVAGGITGAFTAEHAATRTGCGDRVFRRRELAVSASPHSRSEERRRIEHRQAVPDDMVAR